MKHPSLLAAGLFALLACNHEAPPPDPQLLAAAERTVMPNTTEFVTDGKLVSGIYFVVDSGYGYPRAGQDHALRSHFGTDPYSILYIDPLPIVTLGNFTRIATDDALQGGREVRLDMDEAGAARWLVATRLSIGKQLAIVVGDSVVSAPLVQGEIPSGRASISLGSVSNYEVEKFAQGLNAEKKGVAAVR